MKLVRHGTIGKDLPDHEGKFAYFARRKDGSMAEYLVLENALLGNRTFDRLPVYLEDGTWRLSRPPVSDSDGSTPWLPYWSGAGESIIECQSVEIHSSESEANAAAERWSDGSIAFVSWAGGPESISTTDWSCLNDKIVLVVHPEEKAAAAAMRRLVEFLLKNPRMLVLKESSPSYSAYGAARLGPVLAGGIGEEPLEALRKEMTALAKVSFEKAAAAPAKAARKKAAAKGQRQDEEEPDSSRFLAMLEDQNHFRILGRGSKETIILRKCSTHELLMIPQNQISSNRLLQLAPLEWWCNAGGMTTITIREPLRQRAADALNRIAEMKGRISQNSLRGTGSSMDGSGKVIYHLGNKVLCDGASMTLEDAERKLDFVYSESDPLPWQPPASDWRDLASELAEALKQYRWKGDDDGLAFIGWVGSALACGALPWRTNLWMISPSESGKSWLIDHVLSVLFGSHVTIAGDVTEPSAARHSGHNALPMILDEMSAKQLEAVLPLLKRTSSGGRQRIRSSMNPNAANATESTEERLCFYISTTQRPLMGREISSRIRWLRLAKTMMPAAQFNRVSGRITNALAGGKAAAIRNGLVSHAHQVVKRAAEVSRSSGLNYAERRIATIASLAAGAELMHPGLYPAQRAMKMLRDSDGQTDRPQTDASDALSRCLMCPVQHTISYEGNMGPVIRNETRMLGQWLCGNTKEEALAAEQHGFKYIRVRGQGKLVLCIGRHHDGLRKIADKIDMRSVDLTELLGGVEGAVVNAAARIRFAGSQCSIICFTPETMMNLGYAMGADGKIEMQDEDEIDDPGT